MAPRPLRLEFLEDRNAPSDVLPYASYGSDAESPGPGPTTAALSAVSPDDEWPPVELEPFGNDPPVVPPANNPPQIVDFTATSQSPGVWVLSGKVLDENPAGLTVKFGGLTGMQGWTAVTDSNGNFSTTVDFGSQRGEVWARTADAQGLQSNFAYTEIR